MARDEIVDSTGARRRRVQHALTRIGAPLLGVGSVILAILLITFHSYRANRAGALALSREMLGTLQAYVAEQVQAYLEPAVRSAEISRDILIHEDLAARQTGFAAYAASVLRQIDQVEAFYLANSNGDFALLRRAAGGGTETRLLRTGPGGARSMDAITTDAMGHVVARSPDAKADFDPRKRRWFTGAVDAKGAVFWSHPYLFRPTNKPVITASFAVTGEDGTVHVTAVDVALDALSRFMAALKVGKTGRAVVVDRDGRLIAAPELADAKATPQGGRIVDPAQLRIDAIHDPVVDRAFDHFRVEGFGSSTAVIGHATYVTIAAPLPGASPDWVMLIVAPESDFAGFAVANGRQSLQLSLVIVALALGLAGFLIRQGRRTDRLALLLARERETSRDERGALAALSSEPGLLDPAREAPALTETLAHFADARRVSVWRLARQHQVLACDDLFDSDDEGHTGGFELSRTELPRFFAALEEGKPIEVADASSDPRTAELHRLVMAPEGHHAVSIVPIIDEEGTSGAIVIEEARAGARARNLAGIIAGLAAVRMAASHDAAEPPGDAAVPGPEAGPDGGNDAPAAPAPREMEDTPEARRAERSFARRRADAAEAAELEGGYPSLAVLVLAFADTAAASRRDAEAIIETASEIAGALQDIAAEHRIAYVRLVSHQMVAATGIGGEPDPTAAYRLADAALALRDVCLTAMARLDLDPNFRIGIDLGRGMGRSLGREPGVFNLWGDAVRMAELMAATAPELGTIQATEAAYEGLRGRYLFRPRGRFYMPRVGVARSFVLAGRR